MIPAVLALAGSLWSSTGAAELQFTFANHAKRTATVHSARRKPALARIE